MRKASACHLLWPEKRPRQQSGAKAGSSCARAAAWVESPSPPRASPNRICGIGSMVRSVAHNDVRVPKKNAGVRDQDGAGSSRGDSKHEQRSAQRRRPQAGVARRDNEEPPAGGWGTPGLSCNCSPLFRGGSLSSGGSRYARTTENKVRCSDRRWGLSKTRAWANRFRKMRVMIDGSAQRSIGERGSASAGPSRSELCHCAVSHASCSVAHRK